MWIGFLFHFFFFFFFFFFFKFFVLKTDMFTKTEPNRKGKKMRVLKYRKWCVRREEHR